MCLQALWPVVIALSGVLGLFQWWLFFPLGVAAGWVICIIGDALSSAQRDNIRLRAVNFGLEHLNDLLHDLNLKGRYRLPYTSREKAQVIYDFAQDLQKEGVSTEDPVAQLILAERLWLLGYRKQTIEPDPLNR